MARVLVVDDSLSVRKMVERALEMRGFEVLAASSGTEAMERIDSATPDLVVCDVVMPDVDGYRICEFVRAHPTLSETPVLLISGIVNNAVLERAAQVRSSHVLRKPFTADDLARKVDELLAALVDREGFLIEAAGELGVDAEIAGALAACLAESSEGIGREMGQGALSSMILDYEAGMVLLHGAGPSAILAVVLRDPTALGKIRYYVKRALPGMLRLI